MSESSLISFDAPATIGAALKEETTTFDVDMTHASDEEMKELESLIGANSIDVTFEVLEEKDTKRSCFRCWFTLSCRRYIFSGSFSQCVPCFKCSARVHYKSISQFRGCHFVRGIIGPCRRLLLNLSNGVVITGCPDHNIGRAYCVSGRGLWSCGS